MADETEPLIANDPDLQGLTNDQLRNIVRTRLENAQMQLTERILDQRLQAVSNTPTEHVDATTNQVNGLRAAVRIHREELIALKSDEPSKDA